MPDIQKLVNQSGLVASDIFMPRHIRPPVSAMILPLGCRSRSLMCLPASGQCSARPLHGTLCFGAVYCMSSVLTDFGDVKARLTAAITEVRAPRKWMES